MGNDVAPTPAVGKQ